ncbi:uncharacterized protein ACNLHF_027419 [Anomaloglossus baeobatrachus]
MRLRFWHFSSCPSTKEETEDQLLIYRTRFLPSPIFNMEHLMLTNREAQEKYLPFPLYQKRPEPSSATPEEQNEEVITEQMEYQEMKDLEEAEKMRKNTLRRRQSSRMKW